MIDDLNKIPFYSPWFCDKPVLVMMMHLFRKAIFPEVAFPLAAYVYLTESLIPWCYKNNRFAVLSPSSKRDLLAFGIREEKLVVIPPKHRYRAVPAGPEPKGRTAGAARRAREEVQVNRPPTGSRARPEAEREAVQGEDCRRRRRPAAAEGNELRLALESVVEFLGFISEDDKVRFYQESAVLVENSIKEGWGLIVMEANACATPVVAARSPGLVDSVQDRKTGFLYEYGNVPEPTQRLEQLLDDAELRRVMGAQGVRWAESFSWDSATDKMMAVIEQTVGRSREQRAGRVSS